MRFVAGEKKGKVESERCFSFSQVQFDHAIVNMAIEFGEYTRQPEDNHNALNSLALYVSTRSVVPNNKNHYGQSSTN